MSAKEAKPTLGGARIKTRKRNIAVPLDPASFADAVIQIFSDASEEGASLEQNLDAAVKVLETSDLDFSRYGDTLFEVIFTGGRLSTGQEKDAGGLRLDQSILSSDANRGSLKPFFESIQQILRRRPFLIKNIENVLRRLLQQLEHYTTEQQDKLAVATSLTFAMKLGLPPENVFLVLINDVMVAKGTSLHFMTSFMKDFLSDASLDELMILLKRGRVDDLMAFFPIQKRNPDNVATHFQENGLKAIADHEESKRNDSRLKELGVSLVEGISEGTPPAQVISLVKAKKKENNLPDSDLVQLLWFSIMEAVQWGGKNQQQTTNAALRQVKAWAKLLGGFTTSGRLELELMNTIQVFCYEDNKLMKTFPDIIRLLYDQDVLDEATVLTWHKKGSNVKGRGEFLKAMEPFVKWLEEAEEEESEEEG